MIRMRVSALDGNGIIIEHIQYQGRCASEVKASARRTLELSGATDLTVWVFPEFPVPWCGTNLYLRRVA